MHQALRQAIRSAVAQPSFTLMAVTMLALGIGTTAAIVSVVNAVVLRPLPYANEDRLVWVWSIVPTDPLTLATVSVLLIAVALLASWIPAWKAARVNPLVALRYE